MSVFDKTGIVELAKGLSDMGIEIISTGGTAKAISDAGIRVINVSDITGFPECLDGRVKTLHPKIHAGLLAMRDNQDHMAQLEQLGIDTIDMVVINLYPFKQTIQKPGVTLEEAIENIDIGGPTMLRAAAKNYQDVTVVVDPDDYQDVLNEIKQSGGISRDTNFRLAAKVFEHTSHYDTLIAQYLRKNAGGNIFPELFTMTFQKVQDMRYGENPHQKAAFYREVGNNQGWLTDAQQLHGKELSFNNINDTNGALELLKEFDQTAVVAVKHANPCGVGVADSVYQAYIKAHDADPVSIFGGIVVTNREMDEKTAEEINKIFVEIVVAPSYTDKALEILCSKKNIRVLKLENIQKQYTDDEMNIKKVGGGMVIQQVDNQLLVEEKLEVVTDREPTQQEMEDLKFAWKVVKHTKSNAIVVAKQNQTLGVGPGQTNRIWAAEAAIQRAGDKVKGSVMASDAFFPFPDCVEAAAKAGITAIIQPGGSIRDQQSIDACNKYGIAMIFTGMRHFKH